MKTNFDYLKTEAKFSTFADIAISAERFVLMDSEVSILNCRRAMEFAIKWMYSVDAELDMPYQDNLQSLLNAEEYRRIIGPDLWNEWITFADVAIMWHMQSKTGAGMKQCFVWKICLFFWIILLTVMRMNIRSGHLIKVSYGQSEEGKGIQKKQQMR